MKVNLPFPLKPCRGHPLTCVASQQIKLLLKALEEAWEKNQRGPITSFTTEFFCRLKASKNVQSNPLKGPACNFV